MSSNLVSIKGFYFYEKVNIIQTPQEEGDPITSEVKEIVILSKATRQFTWDKIQEVETILQPLNYANLKEAVEQRIVEFTMIQMQIEDGENFGTSYLDWEIND